MLTSPAVVVDLESAARVAGRLESDGFFRPCGEMRAAVVAAAVEPDQPVTIAEHFSGCLRCAGAVDLLRRELFDDRAKCRRCVKVRGRGPAGIPRRKRWSRSNRSPGSSIIPGRGGAHRGADSASRRSPWSSPVGWRRAGAGLALVAALVGGGAVVLTSAQRPSVVRRIVAASRTGSRVTQVASTPSDRAGSADPVLERSAPRQRLSLPVGRSVPRRSKQPRPRAPAVHARAGRRPPPPPPAAPSSPTPPSSTAPPAPTEPAPVGHSAGGGDPGPVVATPLAANAPGRPGGGSATVRATPLQ
jgi:hypothetical protein